MVNEVLQWTFLGVLTVLVVGVLRQVGLAVSPQEPAGPVSGPPVGSKITRDLIAQVKEFIPAGEGGMMLAFIQENCTGCQRLLATLADRSQKETEVPLVIIAKSPSPQFQDALNVTGIPIIADDGQIWAKLDITATPLVVRINTEGRVLAKGVTHLVDSVVETLGTFVPPRQVFEATRLRWEGELMGGSFSTPPLFSGSRR